MKSIFSHFMITVIGLLLAAPCFSQQESSRDWTSFVQTVSVSSSKLVKFKVVAYAKTVSNDTLAWSGIWARVDTKNGESGFFDNMGDRPIISNEWSSYTVEGTINENSKILNFGALCLGNGKFFFDKFEVSIQNSEGNFEDFDISNSSFEKNITSNKLEGWNEGISEANPIRIKEYTFSSSSDVVDGQQSLLIDGSNIEYQKPDVIGPIKGFSPQIGTLISMLDNLKDRVKRRVSTLNQKELDHLMDDKANSVGALIMHLIATEVIYQGITFDNEQYESEIPIDWNLGLALGEEARNKIKGHEIDYYFDLWDKVRAKTIEELGKKDDEWLNKVEPGSSMNNHFAWFHVMEHQSSHLGQILLLSKRIPNYPDAKKLEVKKKD